jgi:hypothetical protein
MATQSVKTRTRKRIIKPVKKVESKTNDDFSKLVSEAKKKEGSWKSLARQYWSESVERD